MVRSVHGPFSTSLPDGHPRDIPTSLLGPQSWCPRYVPAMSASDILIRTSQGCPYDISNRPSVVMSPACPSNVGVGHPNWISSGRQNVSTHLRPEDVVFSQSWAQNVTSSGHPWDVKLLGGDTRFVQISDVRGGKHGSASKQRPPTQFRPIS